MFSVHVWCFLGTVSKFDSSLYMDEGMGCVTTGIRFSVDVMCSLAVRYFCKMLMYNFAVS